MAYFMGVRAVLEGIVSPSLVDLVERIRNGAFDYVLLKPVDAQAMVSASRYEPWKIVRPARRDRARRLRVHAARRSRRRRPTSRSASLLFVAGVLAMYSLWIVCAALRRSGSSGSTT